MQTIRTEEGLLRAHCETEDEWLSSVWCLSEIPWELRTKRVVQEFYERIKKRDGFDNSVYHYTLSDIPKELLTKEIVLDTLRWNSFAVEEIDINDWADEDVQRAIKEIEETKLKQCKTVPVAVMEKHFKAVEKVLTILREVEAIESWTVEKRYNTSVYDTSIFDLTITLTKPRTMPTTVEEIKRHLIQNTKPKGN